MLDDAVVLGLRFDRASKFWRDSQRQIVVVGPMLGPFDKLEDLAPRLCEVIKEKPGAVAGNRVGGQEYCGVIYQRLGQPGFYASHPSTFGPALGLSAGRKGCFAVHAVSDPEALETRIHGDYHSHPSITKFSQEDLQGRHQRFYFRMMFNPACEVYLYDFQERTVLQLKDGQFVPIKRITDDLRGE